MVPILLAIAVFACIALPQLLVKRAMRAHDVDRPDLPGTGGELAAHLVGELDLDGVLVERTDRGSHYDMDARAVRLTDDVFDGRSITAVAVATHEIGHAVQHHRQERGLRLRYALAKVAQVSDKFAAVFFVAAPLIAIFLRAPGVLLGMVVLGVAFLGVRVLVHLVTLPVEFDASYGKALPILREGAYLHEEDLPSARAVLCAAALTYVASAMMGLIDLARWLRFLR